MSSLGSKTAAAPGQAMVEGRWGRGKGGWAPRFRSRVSRVLVLPLLPSPPMPLAPGLPQQQPCCTGLAS